MQELLTRSQAAEEAENQPSNASANPTMGEIIAARYSRRDLLRGGLAVTAISATVAPLALAVADKARADTNTPTFTFKEVAAGSDDRMHVAEGYDADVLIRWGDPVLPGAPPFDPQNQTAAAQAKQFGYNNDYLGYIPLDGSRRGLLVVNHEYTNEELMFPGLGRQDVRDPEKQAVPFPKMTREIAEVEMMAHGGSVLEVARGADGKWSVVPNSRFARRITAETEMEIAGPAAGVERMRTSYDPSGRRVRGMLNNCAGGVTPWGTWLTCEENINAISGASSRTITRRRATTGAWASPATGRTGAPITTASTSGRSRTRRTASAGWSRSIRPTRRRRRRSAPRSGASSTRARPESSTGTAAT